MQGGSMSATKDAVIEAMNAEMDKTPVLEIIIDHAELLRIRGEISNLEYEVAKVEGKYQKKAEQENFERKLELVRLRRLYETGIRTCVSAGNLESDTCVIREKLGPSSRNIQRERFIESFPDVFRQIAEIPLGKADALLGKVTVDSFCDISRKPSTWLFKTRQEEAIENSQKRKRMAGGVR
jgi:hypothetical protein